MADEPKKPEAKTQKPAVKSEKKSVKVSTKLQPIIEAVEKLTVLELAELVKELEDDAKKAGKGS